jgi:AraC-like DNA-binding protein
MIVATILRTLGTSGGSQIRIVRYEPHFHQALHAHDVASLTLVVRGQIEERVGAHVERAGPLSVVVKPVAVWHSDTFGPNGATTLQIVLSAQDASHLAAGTPRLSHWCWSHAAAPARKLLEIFNLASDAAAPDAAVSADEFVLEAVAAFEPVTAPRAWPRWLLEGKERLVSSAQSIRSIASAVGVHPVHFAHEFRLREGMAPTQYRRRERLRRAARLIAETGRPLAEIAIDSGYADQAHMTRDVRRAVGQTPRILRQLAARG